MKNDYVRGYLGDAGVDIVLKKHLIIRPGYNTIELPVKYTPYQGEVAFLVSRGSTAAKGIFPIPVAIDAGYEGNLTAWVFNASGQTHVFESGDRVFAVVNLQLAEDRVSPTILKMGNRGTNKLGSSGGTNENE